MGKSLVLGFFDGVHKAHKAVISSAFAYSDDVTLLTFKESPALYFCGKTEYIMPRKNSIQKIKELGVNDVVEQDFPSIANKNAEEYLRYLIETYSPISISTGFNHTFGLNKSGNPNFLEENQKKYNYKYVCTPQIKDGNDIVSSSVIKKYLKEGNTERANFLLESNFTLDGTVIHGAKLGRTIGFPTANIKYPENIVKIPFGVYGVNLAVCSSSAILSDSERNMTAIMNWGMKPTVHNTVEPVVEVHILNFAGDLYGKNIKIEVLKQIRGEKKFGSLDELKSQIKEDIKACSK